MQKSNQPPIHLGLVGCGDLGNMVLPHFACSDTAGKAVVHAVCDSMAERVQAAQDQFGVPHGYTNYDDLLANDDVDLILLLTPMQLHAPFAIKALEAGKHIYVQKAMTCNLAEADALVEAVRKSGLKAGAAPGQVFSPFFREVRKRVVAGELGKVFWTFTNNAGRGSQYPWYLKEGAGPLNTVTVYSLAALTSVFGPVKAVSALSSMVVPEVAVPGGMMRRECDDNTLILMDFGDGVFAFADGTDAEVPDSLQWGQFSVVAEKASIENGAIHMPSGWPVELVIKRKGGETEIIPVPISEVPCLTPEHAEMLEPHVYSDIMHMVDCILNDTEPEISVEQGRHVVEIIEMAFESARSGQRQTLRTTFTF